MQLENTYFLTFADRRLWRSSRLIEMEAALFGFKKIFAWDERNLDRSFWNTHKDFIKNNPRGFGYWIWKPQAALQVLEQIPEGSCLVYADGACNLNIQGKKRLLEYKKMAENNKGLKMLSFVQTREDWKDIYEWTKMDLLDFFQNYEDAFVCVAAAFVCINTAATRNFMKEWLEIAVKDNYHFVDDSPSVLPNHKKFREHRHDQSIYSLLVYKYNAKIIDAEVQDYKNKYNFPICAGSRKIWKPTLSFLLKYALQTIGLFAPVYQLWKRIKKRDA